MKAPASKSYTIRAVLSALLADGESTIRSPLKSRDTRASFNACHSFGGKLTWNDDSVMVSGTAGHLKAPSSTIDALNSGTTIRIATALASLCTAEVALTGDDSVRKRPVQPLLDALEQLGVSTSSENGCPPATVQGPLKGGSCNIRGDVSSQFITALLMASPYAEQDVTVNVTTELKSRPYVDMTLNMLSMFKIDVVDDGRTFVVPANQTYRPADYTVEGDYSSAAFILAAAALTDSEVTVENLFKYSLQADRKIVAILSDMGADVKVEDDSVTVSGGALHGVTVDLGGSPDLVPIVAAVGSLADGETEIVNAAHARLKECDRIRAMAVELKKMGASVEERDDGLVLSGGSLKGAVVDGWRDHRIIMALCVAALKASDETVVQGAEHVDVTFPDFKEVLNGLGASIK